MGSQRVIFDPGRPVLDSGSEERLLASLINEQTHYHAERTLGKYDTYDLEIYDQTGVLVALLELKQVGSRRQVPVEYRYPTQIISYHKWREALIDYRVCGIPVWFVFRYLVDPEGLYRVFGVTQADDNLRRYRITRHDLHVAGTSGPKVHLPVEELRELDFRKEGSFERLIQD